MAYNILKDDVEFSGVNLGNIEDMINDHADQTIGGTKTFSEMVTASVGVSASFFYGDGTGLTGLVEPAIVTYDGAATNRLIVGSYNSNVVSGAAGLSYDGSSLSVTGDVTASVNVSASAFQGDGNSLTNIGPSSLNLGAGLRDLAGNLEINLDPDAGLQVGINGLKVYTPNLNNLSSSAIAATDQFLVYDDDETKNKRLSVDTLNTYLGNTLPFATVAAGQNRIQFNDADELASSANLTFNSTTGLLTSVSGNFQTLEIEGQSGDNSILTLDKGQDSASYVEFRNGGSKYAEIFGSSAEAFIIRTTTTTANFILRQGGDNLITFSNGTTTFDNNKVTINQELVVTGTMETTSRIHSTTVHTASYSIAAGDEIILMNNSAVATASLPPISSDLVGLALTIKRTGAGTVHISGSNGIDSQPTIDISPQGGFVRIVAADFGGSNYGWAIIAKSGSF